MRHKTVLPLFFIGLFFITWASSQESNAQTAPAPSVKSEEPGSSFQKAVEFFLKKDLKAAAAEIRKGAGFLKEKVKEASRDGKEALKASARELEQLAGDVEKGTETSEEKLKETFARSYQALANHQVIKASESWAKKKTKETGEALTAAARYLEETVRWSGRKLETGTAEVVHYARTVGGKLKKGTAYGVEEVGKGIKEIGREL
jgi:septum formation inhibitor MinC